MNCDNAFVSGSLLPDSMRDITSFDDPPQSSQPNSTSNIDPGGSISASSSSSKSQSSSSRGSSSSAPSIGPPSYPAKTVTSSDASGNYMGGTTSNKSSIQSSAALSSSQNTPSTNSAQSTPASGKPSSSVNTYKTLNYTEVKGIWISYLEIRDMPSNSPAEFRKAIGKVYDNCVSLGINTVYVHARSHGDAYYDSELFPYTKWLSGGFDALEIMIDEAHKRKLSFQAWINPLRGCEAKDVSRTNGYLLGDWIKEGDRAVNVGGIYYLNPAYDDVIKLISDGAAEIVSKYNVDGLHIDDYFYPTTDASFDSNAFKASSYKKLSDFRFANCDRFVRSLYDTVKSCNPNALFWIS